MQHKQVCSTRKQASHLLSIDWLSIDWLCIDWLSTTLIALAAH
jgi:hypothetical protein